MILGMPWLESHNPKINWQKKTIQLIDWAKERGITLNQIMQIINWIREEEPEVTIRRCLIEEEEIPAFINHENMWL